VASTGKISPPARRGIYKPRGVAGKQGKSIPSQVTGQSMGPFRTYILKTPCALDTLFCVIIFLPPVGSASWVMTQHATACETYSSPYPILYSWNDLISSHVYEFLMETENGIVLSYSCPWPTNLP
jgi:hypothetical protein